MHTRKNMIEGKRLQAYYRQVLSTLKDQVILILYYSIGREKEESLPTNFMKLL